jgi:hypothetical protein
MGIREELQEIDDYFASIEETEDDYAELPDGRYQAKVIEARVEHSKSGSRLQLALTFNVIAPQEFMGRLRWKYCGLNPEALEYTKKDIKRLGLELDKLSDLPAMCPMLIGAFVEIGVKTKGEYSNTYINGLLLLPADQEGVVSLRDEDPFDPNSY